MPPNLFFPIHNSQTNQQRATMLCRRLRFPLGRLSIYLLLFLQTFKTNQTMRRDNNATNIFIIIIWCGEPHQIHSFGSCIFEAAAQTKKSHLSTQSPACSLLLIQTFENIFNLSSQGWHMFGWWLEWPELARRILRYVRRHDIKKYI